MLQMKLLFAVLSHGVICFSVFYKIKFGIFSQNLSFGTLGIGVKGLIRANMVTHVEILHHIFTLHSEDRIDTCVGI